ncbi:hypothetical protein D3C83_36720 [compost metagenome]
MKIKGASALAVEKRKSMVCGKLAAPAGTNVLLLFAAALVVSVTFSVQLAGLMHCAPTWIVTSLPLGNTVVHEPLKVSVRTACRK